MLTCCSTGSQEKKQKLGKEGWFQPRFLKGTIISGPKQRDWSDKELEEIANSSLLVSDLEVPCSLDQDFFLMKGDFFQVARFTELKRWGRIQLWINN